MNPSQTSQSSSPTGKIPLHKQFKPVTRTDAGPATLGQTVDQQILQIVSGKFNEQVVRTKFVQLMLTSPGVIGACYLQKDAQGLWTPSVAAPSVGRLPERRRFAEEFSSRCDEFTKSANIQTSKIESSDGQFGLFATIGPRNSPPEILLAVTQSQQSALQLAQTAQKAAQAFQLWLNGRNSADADWQAQALAAIIEIVGKVESQETNKEAAEEVANLLANRTGCDSVAVGRYSKNRMQLEAISGVGKIDQGSDTSRDYLQVLVESATRKRSGLFPAIKQDNNFLLQAHKQLAAATKSAAVYSCPLVGDDDQIVGAVVFTGERELLSSSQFHRFNDAAALPLARSLCIVNKVKQTALTRTKTLVKRKLSFARQLFVLVGAVCLVLLLFLPITYRVRCNCVTEPVSRRFAVAPFDGQIETGLVEAGDLVKSGQVLAEMDGRTINWELYGVLAERQQSLRTREIELSERNVSKTILAELEYDRLVSQEEILQHRRDHLKIKSPIDGVVLSGSLERAEAASVETGQVLFEIGPVKPMRIEVAVPSDEIAQVREGHPAKVWIEGQEDRPVEGEIVRIHPRSETRDADNVFVAEIEFPNDDERLRPGMKGSVRIDCERRSLGWSLFHKPVNYVRSRLTWW
jgi:multidrug resistance efflux pump/nucleotide-binding universal stress UspA family protein